jgi:hypothetical protein
LLANQKLSSHGCRSLADILWYLHFYSHPTWKHVWKTCIRWTKVYQSAKQILILRHAIFNCSMLYFDLINEFIRGAMCFLVCICYFGLVVRHIDSNICKINLSIFYNFSDALICMYNSSVRSEKYTTHLQTPEHSPTHIEVWVMLIHVDLLVTSVSWM